MAQVSDGATDIRVQVRLSHPIVHTGEPTDVFLRVDVTGSGEVRERTPLDLAVVIDRSGSMAGDKLRYAKKAVETLIDRLLPTDHLALVAYGSRVHTVFARRSVDDALIMKSRAALIETEGCTNLSGGLMEGLQQLGHDKAALRRVLLLSDGLANEGVTDLDGLADLARQATKAGQGISAFGVGEDFDETLLRTLADKGGGNYHYIASPDDIPGLFMEELGELGDVVAQNVLLDFAPLGVEILGILGFESLDLPAGMGDVRAGGTRSLMLALRVPPASEGEVVLGTVGCRWTALEDALAPKEESVTVSVVGTPDVQRVVDAVNQQILRAAQLQLAADENQAASRAAQADDEAAFQAHVKRALSCLEALGDVDDPGVREQRRLNEELRVRGLQALREDRDFQKRAHMSQYNAIRGKTSRWFEDDEEKHRPQK